MELIKVKSWPNTSPWVRFSGSVQRTAARITRKSKILGGISAFVKLSLIMVLYRLDLIKADSIVTHTLYVAVENIAAICLSRHADWESLSDHLEFINPLLNHVQLKEFN